MNYLSAAWTAFYYVACPIFYVLNLILSLLAIVIAPLVQVVHFGFHACWYALCALGKFETLYIFFGVAALIGIVTGTSLHYVSGFIKSLLNLESSPEERKGRTLASYRAEKQERVYLKDPMTKLVQNDEGLRSYELRSRDDHMNLNISNQERRPGGSRFNTILEEEDSSDGF